MTDLVEVCPEELVRAAAGCGGFADEVGAVAVRLRPAEVPGWVSVSARSYRHRLWLLERSLTLMAASFDEVAGALLGFGRELREVRVLAEQARGAAFDAGQLRQDRMRPLGDPLRDFVLGPVGPAELVLAERARLLQQEAEQRYGLALLRVVAVLEELTSRVPAAPEHTRLRRTVSHGWEGAKGPVVGFGRLVESLATSLPGVGTARSRHEGRQVLVDVAKGWVTPWEAFEELYRQLQDGQYAQAGGLLAGELVLRRAGAWGKRVELFGAHDDMHLPVLRALRRDAGVDAGAVEEWVAERAQAEFLAELERLRALPLPGVEELVREGADLVQHEAYGGHTILKHLGRDPDWLRVRQINDKTVTREVSTFTYLAEAQRVVASALRASEKAITDWLAGPSDKLPLHVGVPEGACVGVVLNEHGLAVPARSVIIKLRRSGSTVRVVSAYLSSRSP